MFKSYQREFRKNKFKFVKNIKAMPIRYDQIQYCSFRMHQKVPFISLIL